MRDGGQADEGEGPPGWFRPSVAVLLVASVVLAAVGLALPLAQFDVNTRVGPATFILESEFTQQSVEYTGSAPEYGVNVSGELDFIEGTGEYQERIGFLKGTAKERTNYIVPYTTDFLGKRARLNVTVRTETIPWWVVGVKVPCAVDVKLVESKNVSSLVVERVYLEFRREVGGENLTKVVWEKEVSDRLERVGRILAYEADLEASEDWGRFELFGMVEVSMKDDQGVEARHVFKSYSSEPKTITLWTIPVGQGTKIGLLGASMPVTLLGVLLALVAVGLVYGRRRGRLGLAASAGVGLLLGGLFFRIGVTELATLVGYPDDLALHGGYWVTFIAFLPALVAAGLLGWERFRWPPEEEEEEDDEEGGEREEDVGVGLDVGEGIPVVEALEVEGAEGPEEPGSGDEVIAEVSDVGTGRGPPQDREEVDR